MKDGDLEIEDTTQSTDEPQNQTDVVIEALRARRNRYDLLLDPDLPVSEDLPAMLVNGRKALYELRMTKLALFNAVIAGFLGQS